VYIIFFDSWNVLKKRTTKINMANKNFGVVDFFEFKIRDSLALIASVV
jgi:hypothetical protein